MLGEKQPWYMYLSITSFVPTILLLVIACALWNSRKHEMRATDVCLSQLRDFRTVLANEFDGAQVVRRQEECRIEVRAVEQNRPLRVNEEIDAYTLCLNRRMNERRVNVEHLGVKIPGEPIKIEGGTR